MTTVAEARKNIGGRALVYQWPNPLELPPERVWILEVLGDRALCRRLHTHGESLVPVANVQVVPSWAQIDDTLIAAAEAIAVNHIGHRVSQRKEWVDLLTGAVGSLVGSMITPQDDEAIRTLEDRAAELVAVAAMLRKRPNVVA